MLDLVPELVAAQEKELEKAEAPVPDSVLVEDLGMALEQAAVLVQALGLELGQVEGLELESDLGLALEQVEALAMGWEQVVVQELEQASELD